MKAGDEAAAVRRQLERILASPGFVRSERMCRFLRFTVEEALRGSSPANLKEAVIAIQVFDRTADFNPATDPVVRVEARRLRAKLEDYYAGSGAADPLVITLPKGTYWPHFQSAAERPAGSRPAPAEPAAAAGWPRLSWVAALVAVLLAAWALLGGPIGSRGSQPSVAVLPMLDLTDDRSLGNFSDGLTEQLIITLSRIEGLRVPGRASAFRFRNASVDAKSIGEQLDVDHLLESSVRVAGERLRFSAQLVVAASQASAGHPGRVDRPGQDRWPER
jgi:TolB-like protein